MCTECDIKLNSRTSRQKIKEASEAFKKVSFIKRTLLEELFFFALAKEE